MADVILMLSDETLVSVDENLMLPDEAFASVDEILMLPDEVLARLDERLVGSGDGLFGLAMILSRHGCVLRSHAYPVRMSADALYLTYARSRGRLSRSIEARMEYT
jgi:hypothetical protein